MFKKILMMLLILLPINIFAAQTSLTNVLAPQPTTCISSSFSATGDNYWKTVSLKLTNQCGKAVDFQDVSVTFKSLSTINTGFWGNFSTLPWPSGSLQITSQTDPTGGYISSFNLHFPTQQGSTMLAAGSNIVIIYGVAKDNHVDGSTKVYLSTPAQTGTVNFTNQTTRPDTTVPTTATIHLKSGTTTVTDVALPWKGSKTVTDVAAGLSYNVTADSVKDSSGASWTATISPATFTLTAGATQQVSVSYAKQASTGGLIIQFPTVPSEISGYTKAPVAEIKLNGSTTQNVTGSWNNSVTVNNLVAGNVYSFSSPTIEYNNMTCATSFNPATLTAVSGSSLPTTALSYTCTPVKQITATLNVSGAPTTLGSVTVSLTPSDGSTPVTRAVTLQNGQGTATTSLIQGKIFQVSIPAVDGYTVTYAPQPLSATSNVTENITLQASSGTPVSINGRLKVCGTQLCNQYNVPIQLRGMSTHGLQWYYNCLPTSAFAYLANDFKASVVRISMYIQEDGYETDPAKFTAEVNHLIDEVSKKGMYVIVDWHMLEPGDPNYNLERAKTFFTAIAKANVNRNNMFYEIANEPSGVSWNTVKSYAQQLIPVIRAIDPDTIIIVGTPAWSSFGMSDGQSVSSVTSSPLNFPNIMYTFHFYAASHKDSYLNGLDTASNTLPVFVTEWGTQTYTGDGTNDFTMSQKYTDLMAKKKISWTNWNFSDDFRSGAIWKTGTCGTANWTAANLKPAGTWIRQKIISP
ncbi:MAG: cellulase family glycosylhydrolase [Gammaproteobacteria bacterium]|nr:cellulase family glycosylhydrolase [Gammaproteobacteria bacterium]